MATRKLNEEMFCTKCNRMLPSSEFYKSPNTRLHKGGYMCLCKECLKEICQDYLNEYKSLQSAIYFTCATAGIPFIQSAYHYMEDRVAGKSGKLNYFGNYLQAFNTIKKNVDHWVEFADTDTALSEIVTVSDMRQKAEEEIAKFRLDWGDFDDTEDYAFLEYRYDIYTDGLPKLKPAQETLYRKLCIAELNSRKIEAKGESTRDIQKQILDLMNKLKIDNFTEVKDKSLTEQLLETQIATHERQMPMEIYEDKTLYKDMCGLGKGWDDIKRCMINFPFSQKEYPKIKKDGDSNG